ncbi:MAG: hypothetical protein K2L39_06485 [Muribaculaceae bacterium]|nr:hypothetical protein [Muribaculaceae bacterium]
MDRHTKARKGTTARGVLNDEGQMMEAVNLRRDTANPGIWRRGGMPRKVSDYDALPFARFSPFGDGREVCLLCGGDNRLYCSVSDAGRGGDEVEGADSLPTLLGSLPARPLLAVTSTPGMIRLLVAHQPDQYLTYDENLNLTFHGRMPQLPPVKLVAAEYNTLYGAVATVSLSGGSPGTSGSQLNEADNRLLTSALVGCYDRLKLQAAGMGYCSQPVVARYRLLDAAGNTVGVGPSVVLSAAEGFSATEGVVMVSHDNLQTLGEGRIVMPVFRPAVVAPPSLPAPWNRLISKLVVEITEEIEPLQRSLQAPHGVLRDTPSGRVTVTAKLPGFANGTVTDLPRLRRLGLEGMGAAMRVAAEFDTPFAGGIGEVGSAVAVAVSGEKPVSPVSDAAEALSAMGRCWSAALTAGDVTVLCNPLREQAGGWSPDCFVASRDSGEGTVWRMAFSVTLTTPAGTVRVREECGGLGNAPASLSPVLSYPSRDATSLTVTYLSPGGTVYEETFPLTPLPGHDLACHASPGLTRITLRNTVGAYLPSGGELPPRLEEGVAETYLTADLGQRIDRRRISGGEIKGVRILPRGATGWDFSRSKLLFFSEEGTTLSTLYADGRFHSCAPVDHRPVTHPGAICEATGSSGASLLLYAGNDLVEISGQKAATVVAGLGDRLGNSRVDIGWDGTHREVWLAPDDGKGSLFRLSAEGELIRAILPGVNAPAGEDTPSGTEQTPMRFATDRGRLLLATAGGAYDLSEEVECRSLGIVLRHRHHPSSPPGRLTTLIFASDVNGTVTLSGDRGTEIPEPLLRLGFEGAVNSPVIVRLAAPRRRWLETSLSLAASPDLAITGCGVELDE